MLCIQEHHSAIKWIQYFCNESNPVNMDTEEATESVRIRVIWVKKNTFYYNKILKI